MKKNTIHIKKSSGGWENFSKTKLFKSLKRAGLPVRQCQVITNQVTQEIGEGSKTQDIFRKALRLVDETSHVAAVHYSLKKAIFELGPTGYHFESYVGKYFEQLGYKTQTCRTLPGRLVKHEVDVIATKKGKRIFVECKFHNRIGIKNDIKTALYVKARWDDLREGPEGKNLQSFYLASNTVFTEDAITYAQGSGLKLLGVNAPPEFSFLDQVKAMHLYPITSLRRINKWMKQELIDRNILLARELPDHLSLLRKLGMEDSELELLLSEIELLKGSKR
jgi:hypothetical protein